MSDIGDVLERINKGVVGVDDSRRLAAAYRDLWSVYEEVIEADVRLREKVTTLNVRIRDLEAEKEQQREIRADLIKAHEAELDRAEQAEARYVEALGVLRGIVMDGGWGTFDAGDGTQGVRNFAAERARAFLAKEDPK